MMLPVEDVGDKLLREAGERGMEICCVGSSLAIQGPWWMTDLAMKIRRHQAAVVAAWYRRAVLEEDPRLFTGEEYDRLKALKRRLTPLLALDHNG